MIVICNVKLQVSCVTCTIHIMKKLPLIQFQLIEEKLKYICYQRDNVCVHYGLMLVNVTHVTKS